MPIFSSTIQNLAANTMSSPYYRFDGVDDYMSVLYQRFGTDSVTSSDNDISIFCLVKTSSTDSSTGYTGGGTALTILGDTNGTVRSAFGIHGGKVRTTLYSAGSGWTIANSTSSVNDGKWHHIGFVFDVSADEVKFYIDGVLDNTATLTYDLYAWAWNIIGAGYKDGTNHYDFFEGEISDLNIHNRLLTSTEVKELYAGGSVPFKYKGANQTNVMTNANAANATNESNATGNWAVRNNAVVTSDSTTWTGSSGSYSIKVVTSAANSGVWGNIDADTYPYSILPNGSFTTGKKYRMTYTVKQTAGTASAECYTLAGGGGTAHDTTSFSTSGDGITTVEKEFIAEGTSMYFAIIGGSGATFYLDSWKIIPIGAVAEYDSSGASDTVWYDKSGNDLNGTVTGATLENKFDTIQTSGITFPATAHVSSNANTLDDYEEGTWNPTWVPSGTNYNSITYHADTGARYTKIGQVVHLNGCVRVDSLTFGSANGYLFLGNLPFTSAARSDGDNADFIGTCFPTGNFDAGEFPTFLYLPQSNTYCYMYYLSAVGSTYLISNVEDILASGGYNRIHFSLTYVAA